MITWEWDKKVGEMILEQSFDGKTQQYAVSVYKGNVFAVLLYEYKNKSGEGEYSMKGFFFDKADFKKNLGLDKKCKETYGKPSYPNSFERIVSITIDKGIDKYFDYKTFCEGFMETCDDIEIKITDSRKTSAES